MNSGVEFSRVLGQGIILAMQFGQFILPALQRRARLIQRGLGFFTEFQRLGELVIALLKQ